MSQILDNSQALGVSDCVLELQDDLGYPDEEFIPGLVQAIIQIARRSRSDYDQILDEAANFLADGGE